MKKITGIFLTLLLFAGIALLILCIWDISVISWSIVWRILITIGILGVTVILYAILQSLFFKTEHYNKTQGNNTHPIE